MNKLKVVYAPSSLQLVLSALLLPHLPTACLLEATSPQPLLPSYTSPFLPVASQSSSEKYREYFKTSSKQGIYYSVQKIELLYYTFESLFCLLSDSRYLRVICLFLEINGIKKATVLCCTFLYLLPLHSL